MTRMKLLVAVVASIPAWSVAAATLPCPTPTFQPCNSVVVTSLVQVDHSDSRAGQTGGSFVVGGAYGSGTTDLVDNGNRFSRTDLIRSTGYVASTAEATTTDRSLFARARGEADLARGTMRAQIEGSDTTLFPNSLMEVSQARLDIWLRDTVTFHLPANFGGGKVRVSLHIDGSIDDPRPRGVFGSTEVVAQLNLGAGSGNSQTRRWVGAGTITDVITLEYTLIQTSSAPLDQLMGFESFLRLSSGDGNGSYAIDFFNTARATMQVPTGVAWDSRSGVFLSAVPETQVSVAMLIGLALVGVAVRRERRVRVV